MAVIAARDYMFSPHIRTVAPGAGPSSACVVVTRRGFYMIPHVSISGGGVTITRTTVTIGGMPPAQYFAGVLADPSTTTAALDQLLASQCAAVTGAVAKDLSAFKRIKIRDGFFSRGVRLTERAQGLWGNPLKENFAWRPSKDEVAGYASFFAGDPRLV
ncbi:MAG: hypothetical protein ABI467_11300 [Kofleriaceae bacterium]